MCSISTGQGALSVDLYALHHPEPGAPIDGSGVSGAALHEPLKARIDALASRAQGADLVRAS